MSHETTDDQLVRMIGDAFANASVPSRPSDAETLQVLASNTSPTLSRNTRPDVLVEVPPKDEESLNTSLPSKPQTRNSFMKIMIPLATAAAGLAMVLGFWPHNNTLLAQMIRNVEQAEAATFSISLKISDDATVSGKGIVTSDKLRIDWTSHTPTTTDITDYAGGEQVSFSENSQQLHVIKRDGIGGFDPLRNLKDLDHYGTREAPAEQNNIENTALFEVAQDGVTGRIWVDTETKLPVRIEMKAPGKFGEVVLSDIDWNAEVDASAFALPEGRTVVKNNLLADPTEAELIAAVVIRNAFTGQAFDDQFLGDGCGLRLGRLSYDLDGTREANHQRQLEKLTPHLGVVGLTQGQAQNARTLSGRVDYLCMKLDQWEHLIKRHGGWVGTGVRPGEAKPICWWQLPGKGIRVLNADLTINDADTRPTGN